MAAALILISFHLFTLYRASFPRKKITASVILAKGHYCEQLSPLAAVGIMTIAAMYECRD